MASAAHLFVGTAGMSVWFSKDGGESWTRPYVESGLYLECRVWALSSHPKAPQSVYAGTDRGIFRWDRETQGWTHLPSQMDRMHVWALAQSPSDPDILIAGTHNPTGLFRSTDGGKRWTKARAKFAPTCVFIGTPRITQVLFDPLDEDVVWAGVEIDGIYKSKDGGRSFKKTGTGLISDDVHGITVAANNSGTMFATTNKGLHRSDDRGESWTMTPLDSPWQYTRTVKPAATTDGTMFLTNGNGPPGSTGRLLKSRDHGGSWSDVCLPGKLNSTPWCVATHESDPDQIYVATNLGQLYKTADRGASWNKLDRELGEVRAAIWLPA